MAQRIFNKMAGIIRGKKAEPDVFSEDSSGLSYPGQHVHADGESDGAGTSGFADHNGLRPQAFDDNLKLSDLFRDEGENGGAPERMTAPIKSQIAVSPKFQQVAPMSRELTQSHSNQPADMIPADLIETVGRENEGLRHRCEEVVRKVEEAATLRQDLSAVFSHVDVILKDLERTKTALAQRTAALAAERDGSNDLKARHRQLIGDHEQLRGEHVNLLGERQKHIDAVGDAEAQIGSLQDALSEKTKQFTDVTRRSEGDRERLSQADTDLRAAREEMQRTDDLIFSLQSDLSAARDHATLVEEDNKTLQVNLADARQQIARLARKENEAHAMLAAHKQRIDDLDLMVNSERVEHGKTRNLWQSESTNRRPTLATDKR